LSDFKILFRFQLVSKSSLYFQPINFTNDDKKTVRSIRKKSSVCRETKKVVQFLTSGILTDVPTDGNKAVARCL